MSLKVTAHRLLGYAKRYKTRFGAGIVSFLIASAIEPLIPALFKKLLDSGFQAAASFPIWVVPLVVVGLFMVRGLATYSGTYLMNDSASRVVLDIRRDLMGALVRADAQLFSSLTPGLAVNKIIADPQHAVTGLSGGLNTLLRDASTFLFLFAYLFYVNWQLTLLSIVVLPLLIFVVRRLHRRLSDVGSREYESQQRLVNIVDDAARAWRVIRTFDAGDFEKQRFEQEAGLLRRLVIKRISTSALMTPATQIVAALGVALILTLALWQARQGQASVGEFVAFITALLMTISPLRHLTDVSQPILHSLISVRGAFELMDTPPEPDPGTREIERISGHIDIDHLWVQYPQAVYPALRDVSMQIQPGQTIALVGASGAGKTTLVNTLLGFAQPSQGRVLIDQTDIQELRRQSLRRHFAVVSQDIVLFDGSIADNVAYAQVRDDARVMECLTAANLGNYIAEQPEGINAYIGVNGSRLSGGQRQRLAIARALYKRSAIWIFDEATSALDAESESFVQQSIERWGGDKTIILIAHRLSTVQRADCIYVFTGGQLIESGTHRALIEQGGTYAAMVQAQSLIDARQAAAEGQPSSS